MESPFLNLAKVVESIGLYAAVDFQAACRAADVKPVFGVELGHDGKRAVVLARDAAGYGEICRLVSRRHLDADFRLGSALAGTTEHVFVLCGDPALLAGLRGRTHVYVELVCHHDVASRRRKYHLLDVARRLGLPVVATNNVHYAAADDYRLHDVLTATRHSVPLAELGTRQRPNSEFFLKDAAQMGPACLDEGTRGTHGAKGRPESDGGPLGSDLHP